MRSFSTTALMPALRTSTSGAAASTVTVSSSEPSSRAALIVGVAPTCSTMPGLHVSAESLQRDLEPVRPGGQVRDEVRAVFVGDGRAHEARSRSASR